VVLSVREPAGLRTPARQRWSSRFDLADRAECSIMYAVEECWASYGRSGLLHRLLHHLVRRLTT